VAGIAAALTLAAMSAANAQSDPGSASQPPRLALFAGAFDVLPDGKRPHSGADAELGAEYRLGPLFGALTPFLGLSGTSAGGFYGYFGFGIDIDLGRSWVLNPNVAAGYWARGGGIDLGSWWEFREGVELDYRLSDWRRLGVAFYHISNAGLTQQDPGAESALLVYTVPLP
jgi:lipid A 3-O-deacylase